jgi:hypothetical protein
VYWNQNIQEIQFKSKQYAGRSGKPDTEKNLTRKKFWQEVARGNVEIEFSTRIYPRRAGAGPSQHGKAEAAMT